MGQSARLASSAKMNWSAKARQSSRAAQRETPAALGSPASTCGVFPLSPDSGASCSFQQAVPLIAPRWATCPRSAAGGQYTASVFLRRLFSFILPLVLSFALIASACSSDDSSDDDAVATADGEAAASTDGTADPDEDGSSDVDADTTDTTGEAASTDTTDTDGSEAPPIVSGDIDPEVAGSLIGQLLGGPADSAATTCVVDEAAVNAPLNEVLVGVGQPDFTFTPERFAALAASIQGCVGNEAAVEALRPLAGAEAPAQDAALTCMQPLFAEDDGSDTYAALAAIAVGLPPLETGIPLAVGALTDCVAVDTIVDQLAGQAEAEQGFAIEIDRECVASNFGTDQTAAFWESIVRQDTTMIATVETITADCSALYDSGLLKEIPADFEEWSGQGTLALVDPQLRNNIYSGPPPMVIDPDANYEAILTTERGVIRIELFPDVAPTTVNNFVALARDGYYDNIFFHRVLGRLHGAGR
ncbi:Peptidyl-prolyl cis-trans isomerase [Nymphon striatum]|nr:Peptidyl-prolyl cis-trans isomerase [Nymphon striatum]